MFKSLFLTIIIASSFLFYIEYPDSGLCWNFGNGGLRVFYSIFELPIKFAFSTLGILTIWGTVHQANLQRQSFIYSVFQQESDALKNYLDSCLKNGELQNLEPSLSKVNHRQLLKKLIGSPKGNTDYNSPTTLKKLVAEFRKELEKFSSSADKEELDKEAYQNFIEKSSRELGIVSQVEDLTSAIALEKQLKELMGFISTNWFNTPEIEKTLLEAPNSHH